jgi:hypothetical protein
MLVVYFLQSGLWKRLDGEKARFFFGWTSPLFLSHARPMRSSFHWWKLLLDPGYAKAAVAWLSWRLDLFDGGRS